jgi:hypothetical protein
MLVLPAASTTMMPRAEARRIALTSARSISVGSWALPRTTSSSRTSPASIVGKAALNASAPCSGLDPSKCEVARSDASDGAIPTTPRVVVGGDDGHHGRPVVEVDDADALSLYALPPSPARVDDRRRSVLVTLLDVEGVASRV